MPVWAAFGRAMCAQREMQNIMPQIAETAVSRVRGSLHLGLWFGAMVSERKRARTEDNQWMRTEDADGGWVRETRMRCVREVSEVASENERPTSDVRDGAACRIGSKAECAHIRLYEKPN